MTIDTASGDIGAPPYDGLTPECLLDALESAGLRGDGRLLALNSYENRVYQVWLEDGEVVVVKFYRPGRWTDAQILEEHAFAQELVEHEIPIVAPLRLKPAPGRPELASPPRGSGWAKPGSGDTLQGRTLHRFGDFRFAVQPRRGGRAPELDDPATLAWIGRFIGRIHTVGATRRFLHRPDLDIERMGREPRTWLMRHDMVPPALLPAWQGIVDQAIDAASEAFARLPDLVRLRLHGDCHAGNVLWTDDGPHFVDLDDACNGPAIQDLWMLLAGDPTEMGAQMASVLRGYEAFRPFDRRELALIEPLRTLRLIHYSAWIARRWNDPAFPAAFPWFGSERYWQDRILELREQVAAMSEPPIAPVTG